MEGYGNENSGAFQPTRPLRGATGVLILLRLRAEVISTHAPLAGRDDRLLRRQRRWLISTHAPLAGRDNIGNGICNLGYISTHAPLAGRDLPPAA